MKLTRYAIVLYALIGMPCLSTGQNIIHYNGQYELWEEENTGHLDFLIKSKLLLSHDNGGEFVKMYAEGGPAHGVLQVNGAGQDTASGAPEAIYPTSCLCLKYRDTIEISSVFVLGVTFNFKVYTNEEQYKVEVLSGDDSDNNLIYKQHPEDEEFVSHFKSEFQEASFKLYLSKEETDDPVIYGAFTGEVSPYYERLKDGQLKKQHYRLTSLFKCKARDIEEILDEK